MKTSQGRIVIIGAGIAGLLLARRLVGAGHDVRVLEKSRGVGGRMATKRVGGAVFDSGAQFFTVRDLRFAELVQEWESRGVVTHWVGGGEEARWVGRPTMTAIAKALAEGLDVQREAKVIALQHSAAVAGAPAGAGPAGWTITLENAAPLSADTVLVAAPVPQAVAWLDAGGEGLAVPEELRAVSYLPCLALLVTLAGESAVPAAGVRPTDGPLRSIVDNGRKGRPGAVDAGQPVGAGVRGSASSIHPAPGAAGPGGAGPVGVAGQAGMERAAPPGAAVTLHATPEFSAAHYGATEAEVAALLLPAARAWLGAATVISATLHRWRYSEPAVRAAGWCHWDAARRLGWCGDAFGGGRVEGAALSGLALAHAVVASEGA